jgi:hypothetical protein
MRRLEQHEKHLQACETGTSLVKALEAFFQQDIFGALPSGESELGGEEA